MEKQKKPTTGPGYNKPGVEKRVSTDELQRDAKYAGGSSAEPAAAG